MKKVKNERRRPLPTECKSQVGRMVEPARGSIATALAVDGKVANRKKRIAAHWGNGENQNPKCSRTRIRRSNRWVTVLKDESHRLKAAGRPAFASTSLRWGGQAT